MGKIVILPIKNGRTGNNLFQLSYAHYVTKHLKNSELINFSMSELNINAHIKYDSILKLSPFDTLQENEDYLRIMDTSRGINSDLTVRSLAWGMQPIFYEFSKKYLLNLTKSFLIQKKTDKFKKYTICHIRGGDIWKSYKFRSPAIHPNYMALPISYYKLIRQNSKLPLLFLVDKTTPRFYLKILQSEFKGSEFIWQGTVSNDFSLLNHGGGIALSTSTFAWMSAFLGEHEIVHVPRVGIFDSKVRPDLHFRLKNRNVVEYIIDNHEWSGNRQDLDWLMNAKVEICKNVDTNKG